jgi:pimeloyl-ACP methyl ester carboxylesterase
MLPGHMCDRRLWSCIERDLLTSGSEVSHADLTRHDSMQAMAAAILEKAPASFVAVGLSMGGIVALELLRLEPSRVAAVILSDTNPAPEAPHRASMRRAQQVKVQNGSLAGVVRDELKPAYLAPENRHRHDILDLTYAMAMDLGADVFMLQSEALISRADYRPTLSQIQCPSLVMCGAEDPVCLPEWHRDIADAIAGAELHLIKGAGHLPPLEQPQRFSQGVLSWLHKLH